MKKLIFLFSLLSLAIDTKPVGYCDIKGNVVNPGVYEIKQNYTIQDIINLAGGLKNNSYTDNINLSKIVKDEMVIYIHNKNEIEKIKELNNCKCEPIIKYIECEETKDIKQQTTTTTITNITIPSTTTKKTSSTTTQNIKNSTTIKSSTTTTHLINDKVDINTCTIEELMKLNGY